jgi:S-DNA-T family DNA segregation ATPase FtsK/SpoIIIE
MEDDLYDAAVKLVRTIGHASPLTLQRNLHIGYGRATGLVKQMEADGIVSPPRHGTLQRDVIAVQENLF